MGETGELPVCPLCQPPFVLSVEPDQNLYEYAQTKSFSLRIRLRPRDSANAYIPLTRMQVDVHLPAGFEYDPNKSETGWTLDLHRRGRHVRFNSPPIFLATVQSGDPSSAAELVIGVKLLSSIQRQFRRVQAYSIEITTTPLDGLTRKLETRRERVRIRRPAWLHWGEA